MCYTESISLKKDKLQESLLPLLLGKVFHVTNGNLLESILSTGALKNNRAGEYKTTFSQSKENYGTRTGMVCLIDLRDRNYEQALTHANDGYYFLRPVSTWDSVAFFILSDNYYCDLKLQARFCSPHKGKNFIPMEDIYKGTYIPEIECWYPDSISMNKVSKIIFVSVTE